MSSCIISLVCPPEPRKKAIRHVSVDLRFLMGGLRVVQMAMMRRDIAKLRTAAVHQIHPMHERGERKEEVRVVKR